MFRQQTRMTLRIRTDLFGRNSNLILNSENIQEKCKEVIYKSNLQKKSYNVNKNFKHREEEILTIYLKKNKQKKKRFSRMSAVDPLAEIDKLLVNV